MTHAKLRQSVRNDIRVTVYRRALGPSATHTLECVGSHTWWELRRQVKDPVDNVLCRGLNDREAGV